MFQFVRFFLLILFISGCSQKSEKQLGFYYWKMNTSGESMHSVVNKMAWMYVKLYDVKWKETGAYPAAKQLNLLKIDSIFQKSIVPVIYITNEVFLKADSSQVVELVENLKIGLNDYQSMTSTWSEVQIDCDWTEKSKERYFQFLQLFKNNFPNQQISVTLRLYPYKYATKMGIPPVDKAMLMAYNVGNIQIHQTKNSILDYNEAKLYLTHNKYPLPLDLALPTFGWHVWFSKGVMKGIIYEDEFHMVKKACVDKGNNHLVFNEEVETDYHFFQKGDEFRREYPTESDILATYQKVLSLYPSLNRIVFFHYNLAHLNHYETLIDQF